MDTYAREHGHGAVRAELVMMMIMDFWRAADDEMGQGDALMHGQRCDDEWNGLHERKERRKAGRGWVARSRWRLMQNMRSTDVGTWALTDV